MGKVFRCISLTLRAQGKLFLLQCLDLSQPCSASALLHHKTLSSLPIQSIRPQNSSLRWDDRGTRVGVIVYDINGLHLVLWGWHILGQRRAPIFFQRQLCNTRAQALRQDFYSSCGRLDPQNGVHGAFGWTTFGRFAQKRSHLLSPCNLYQCQSDIQVGLDE